MVFRSILIGIARNKDNSGTIDRDEFLSLPQVSSNPLASRYGATPIPLFSFPANKLMTDNAMQKE